MGGRRKKRRKRHSGGQRKKRLDAWLPRAFTLWSRPRLGRQLLQRRLAR
jgi:hypothetical protein